MKIKVHINSDNESSIKRAIEFLNELERDCDVECDVDLNLLTRNCYDRVATL